MNTNLKEISNFIKKNNSYSDFNLVNNFLLNLNFTKINFNKNLRGGGDEDGIIQQQKMIYNNLPPDMIDTNNLPPGMIDTNNLPPGMIEPNLQPGMIDDNLQPGMIDPNLQPGMIDDNLQPGMIDDNLPPGMIEPNLQPGMIDTNLPPGMIYNNLPPGMSNIQKLPDMYLQNPPYTTDRLETYTIREGTILYHATSNKKGFNTNYINLGQDKLINFFTPNFRLASDKIEGCSVDKQNGYIHVFRVVKDIPNIYVKLPYDIADDINSGLLANEFCSNNQNYYGIGFFYPKNNIEMFSNNIYQQSQPNILDNPDQYYSEFGLCNPKPYLEYLYSQRCQSLRKLSEPYRFD